MKEFFVKNIKIPLIILGLLNIINYIYVIPVSLQMVGQAILLIYIGSILSASIKSASYSEIRNC